jgi:hypothetical protein
MTLLRQSRLPRTLSEPTAPETLRVTLANAVQGRHLLAALRGHCEVERVPESEGVAVVISVHESGNRGVLRRVDAWLHEFNVASAALEFNGRTYEITNRD